MFPRFPKSLQIKALQNLESTKLLIEKKFFSSRGLTSPEERYTLVNARLRGVIPAAAPRT